MSAALVKTKVAGAPSLAEAKAIAEAGPMLQVGRLAVALHPGGTAKGRLPLE
jgi:hypothetical protein